jgi:hypothetical protein
MHYPVQNKKNLLRYRNQYFFISDVIFFLVTPFMALLLRLDWDPDLDHVTFNQVFYPYQSGLLLAMILFPIVKLLQAVLVLCHLRRPSATGNSDSDGSNFRRLSI